MWYNKYINILLVIFLNMFSHYKKLLFSPVFYINSPEGGALNEVETKEDTSEMSVEQKAQELKKAMDEALADNTVDKSELIAVQDKFHQDENQLDTSLNEQVQETVKEFKEFQKEHSLELFTQGVKIDKTLMSQERFEDFILLANLNCDTQTDCFINYEDQPKNFEVKLVNWELLAEYKFSLDQAKAFNTAMWFDSFAISTIQWALLSKWANMPLYWADGDFWKESYDALVTFQKENWLIADGKAGEKTLAKLWFTLEDLKSQNTNATQETQTASVDDILTDLQTPTQAINEEEKTSFWESVSETFDDVLDSTVDTYNEVKETVLETYEESVQWLREYFKEFPDAGKIDLWNGEFLEVEYDSKNNKLYVDTQFFDGISDYKSEVDLWDISQKSPDQLKSLISIKNLDFVDEYYNAIEVKEIKKSIKDIVWKGYNKEVVIDAIKFWDENRDIILYRDNNTIMAKLNDSKDWINVSIVVANKWQSISIKWTEIIKVWDKNISISDLLTKEYNKKSQNDIEDTKVASQKYEQPENIVTPRNNDDFDKAHSQSI